MACALAPISMQVCAAHKQGCSQCFCLSYGSQTPSETWFLLCHTILFFLHFPCTTCSAGSIPIVMCVWTEIHVLQLWLLLQHCPLGRTGSDGISGMQQTQRSGLPPSPPTKPLRTHQPGSSSPATADPAVPGIAPLHGHLQLQRALLLAIDPIWTPTEVPACSLHPGHANSL